MWRREPSAAVLVRGGDKSAAQRYRTLQPVKIYTEVGPSELSFPAKAQTAPGRRASLPSGAVRTPAV